MNQRYFRGLGGLLVSAALMNGCGDDDDTGDGGHAGGANVAGGTSGTSGQGGTGTAGSSGGSAGASGAGAGGSGAGAGGASCGAAALTYCDRLDQCSPFTTAILFADQADCTAQISAECDRSIQAPGSHSTAANYAACVDAFTCDSATVYLSLAECVPPPGDKSTGESCFDDAQCASSSCFLGGAKCGTCRPMGQEGQSCASAHCAVGLACRKDDLTCRAPAALGQSCAALACKAGLLCGQDNTCTEAGTKKVGEACSTATDCNVLAGVTCRSSHTCGPLPVAQVGQACGVVNAEYVFCHAGTTCQKGTCALALHEGDPCKEPEQGDDDACGYRTQCQGGVCVSSDPACP